VVRQGPLDPLVDPPRREDHPEPGVDGGLELLFEPLALALADGSAVLEGLGREAEGERAVLGRPPGVRYVDGLGDDRDADVPEGPRHRLRHRVAVHHDPVDQVGLPLAPPEPGDDLHRVRVELAGLGRDRLDHLGQVRAEVRADLRVARPRQGAPDDGPGPDLREGSGPAVERVEGRRQPLPVAALDGRRVEAGPGEPVGLRQEATDERDERRRPVAVAVLEVRRRPSKRRHRGVVDLEPLEHERPGVGRGHVAVLVDDELRRAERPERGADDAAHGARVGREGGQGVACHARPEWWVSLIGVGIVGPRTGPRSRAAGGQS
jgi:hypothetical protein